MGKTFRLYYSLYVSRDRSTSGVDFFNTEAQAEEHQEWAAQDDADLPGGSNYIDLVLDDCQLTILPVPVSMNEDWEMVYRVDRTKRAVLEEIVTNEGGSK